MENGNHTETLIPLQRAAVELHKDNRNLKLRLKFARKPAHGPLVALDPEFVYEVESANELAATYTMSNWMSGIISGVAYASRKLKLTGQGVYVEHFEGRLGSADMGTVANAAALAVALLAGKECPALDLDGWLGQWSTNSESEQSASGSLGSPETGAVACK